MMLLEQTLQREIDQAKVNLSARTLLGLMLLLALLGALLASPFKNGLLMVIAAAAFGAAPYQVIRARLQARARTIHLAVEPMLVQLARLCEVRRHPFLALTDALPLLSEPLRSEFQLALADTQAGLPLPDALRQLATRCCDDFYLHQVAELVAIHVRAGGDLVANLQRLANRLRTMEELRAEETAELFGYKWLTRLLFGATLAPLAYWAITGSPSLQLFVKEPLPQAILIWVILSGFAIASLPYWMAIED